MSAQPSADRSSARDRAHLEGALDQLRLRLLDLSGRNRLLNFKHTAGRSLQFVTGQPAALYQRLMDTPNRAAVSIAGLPEPPRKDWVERNGRLSRPDPREWARQNDIPTSYDLDAPAPDDNGSRVRALLYPDDLAKNCRKVEREAVSAIEETGANMLFLVLGFLEFPDQRNSDRSFMAPLISVPVLMSKIDVSGNQVFSLQYTGDDITENLSLREKLKEDYGLLLPEIDDDQFNIENYLSELQQLIQPRPGFRVRQWVSLCILSFANMLLVRDLDPSKWPQAGERNGLLDHDIVREVFEGRSTEGNTDIGDAPEYDVEDGPAEKISLVFDADSSQHCALVDVLVHHRNLVIEGPPGTGKSQTIANLIAAGIQEGKKVLFVSEKLAALEVVLTRLHRVGLDPFVLELHSNKSNKKRVLEELAKRVAFRAIAPASLPHKLQQLEGHRRDLKAYDDLINSISHNSFGFTLHKIMWRAETHRLGLTADEKLLTQATISDATEISEFELSRRTDCLSHLGAQYIDIGGFDIDSALWGFFPDRMVPGDEIRIQDLFSDSQEWADRFVADVAHLAALSNTDIIGLTPEHARAQLTGLEALLDLSRECPYLHLLPRLFANDRSGATPRRALNSLADKLKQFHELTPVVQTGLRREEAATPSQIDSLLQLARVAEALGATLGTPSEINDLCNTLRRQCDSLETTAAVIKDFCTRKGIPYEGTRAELDQLSRIATLVMEAPHELFHLQHPGLAREGCHRAIVSLAALQNEWTELHATLNEYLYVDMLPSEDAIRMSILTLRGNASWYCVFQRDWRSAVATHKRIHRAKQRLKIEARLAHLEEIFRLVQLRERWKSDPAWANFLGTASPAVPSPLDDYQALAEWNSTAREVMESFPTSIISLHDLTREKARVLKREFEAVASAIATTVSAFEIIGNALPRAAGLHGRGTIEKSYQLARSLVAALQSQLDWLKSEVPDNADLSACIRSCDAAVKRQNVRSAIQADNYMVTLLGDHFCGTETDATSALNALAFGDEIDALPLSPTVRGKLKVEPFVETAQRFCTALENVIEGFSSTAQLAKSLSEFGRFELETWIGCNLKGYTAAYAAAVRRKVYAAVDAADLIIPWSRYVVRREDASGLGLNGFVALLESKRIRAEEISRSYAYCTFATIVRSAFRAIPQLGKFSGLMHNQIRDEFARLDHEIIGIRGKAIAAHCGRNAYPPTGLNGTRVDDKTEMVLLNYLMPQQRPRMPVRKMISRAGRAVQTLKPCFMMGPQAVAQYLTPGVVKFDLVIMDEASQLKPEEAIGAIARGGQLVVVGDSRQLPPTSFFSRMGQVGDDDDQYTTTDAESILDLCAAHFHPSRPLRWHYRSQHHSLIAFSNEHFYRRNLIVFPSPYGQSSRLGVRATYLADAAYDNQSNLKEAERVVAAVREHIVDRPDESLGVVTLNIKQRDLIAELLDERLRDVPGADTYRELWASEGQPLFVKNLENVQGDERDAIVISTTFGRAAGSGVVRQNFGPISRQGGWRRLNVLFTRARKSVAVYTSLRPEDIVLDGTTPEGTKALRNYLEYARTGLLVLPVDEGREPDSDFEVAVISVLRARGYEVTPQLGVAGFRIDIAVKHPESLGTYLAAIECDGASYHSARSVRDRDRIRQEILEGLGWRGRIWRIWSTDWFRSPRMEIEKLMKFLEDIRANWKPDHVSGDSWVEEGVAWVEPETDKQEADQGLEVRNVVLETEEDLEVQVGDVVRYIDIQKPDDILTAQITHQVSDLANGLVSAKTPLAQALLGAIVMDEVALHLPGTQRRTFRITGITRPG
jgi:hypothetical protein